MENPNNSFKELKLLGETNSNMLETILQVVTNMQTFNHKIDKRLSNLELEVEIIKSNQRSSFSLDPAVEASHDKHQITPEWASSLDNKIDDISQSSKRLEVKFDGLDNQMKKQETQLKSCSSEVTSLRIMTKDSSVALSEASHSLKFLTDQSKLIDWKVGKLIMISAFATSKIKEELDNLTDKTSNDSSGLSKEVKTQVKKLSDQISSQGNDVNTKIEEQTETFEAMIVTQTSELKETVNAATDESTAEASASASPAKTYSEEFTVTRFDASSAGQYWWYYDDGEYDNINFTVDKPVSVTGFSVYGPRLEHSNSEVTIRLLHQASKQVLATKNTTLSGNGKSSPYSVRFDEPIHIVAGTIYTASTFIKGMHSWYGIKGQAIMKGEGGVTFKFNNSNDNETSVEEGQISDILYKIVV